MILPDVNLLVHAHNIGFRRHAEARDWWESLMNGDRTVGIPWVSVLGFIRISTNGRILERPLEVSGACSRVRAWLERPQSFIIHPGERHASIFFELLESVGTAGNLTTDAHLAALAIEYQGELHSTDADMSRFSGVRWVNPLSDTRRQE